MTLLEFDAPENLLAVRFACSPAWETFSAVRTFVDARDRSYHDPWHEVVRERVAQLDLSPLVAIASSRGFVPDFLTPPPRTSRPRLRDQLAEIRATPPERVAYELAFCRDTLRDARHRRLVESLLADPAGARDLLADRLQEAWSELVAPVWIRIRTLLDRDVEQRSRTLARHGLRRVLDQLHPSIRWTERGLAVADRRRAAISVDDRGLVLMPTAFAWPSVAVIGDEPWQPTIVYPARGVGGLWRAPTPPPDSLARLLGKTRALVLVSLGRPIPTTTLGQLMELSPGGVSRHLLALRDAGLVSTTRHGHEVRYRRSALGTALLRAAQPKGTTAAND